MSDITGTLGTVGPKLGCRPGLAALGWQGKRVYPPTTSKAAFFLEQAPQLLNLFSITKYINLNHRTGKLNCLQ
jgi:hypothetical protein